jgi:hypothetical protein
VGHPSHKEIVGEPAAAVCTECHAMLLQHRREEGRERRGTLVGN